MRPLGMITGLAGIIALSAWAQDGDLQTTYCNFTDGSQISVQYDGSGKHNEEPKNGKVWEPGGAPMTLYTQVPVVLNKVEIPVGAFAIYAIPNKKEWTLIVNKNVAPGSKYDESQDLARSPMELGDLSPPVKPVQVALAHMATKTCTLRISYGSIGAQADFLEK
jgi:Protein of unknown function (DUF2911)